MDLNFKWNGGDVAVVLNGRIVDRRSNWHCTCGPHAKQEWSVVGYTSVDDPTGLGNPVYVPIICFEHKRHVPCREKEHEWDDPYKAPWD